MKRRLCVYAVVFGACVAWYWVGGRAGTGFDIWNAAVQTFIMPIAVMEIGKGFALQNKASWRYLFPVLLGGLLLLAMNLLTVGMRNNENLRSLQVVKALVVGMADTSLGLLFGVTERRYHAKKDVRNDNDEHDESRES